MFLRLSDLLNFDPGIPEFGSESRRRLVMTKNWTNASSVRLDLSFLWKESYSVTCQEDYEASLPAELKERHERREEELSGPPPGTKAASHKKRGKAPRFSTPKVWRFLIQVPISISIGTVLWIRMRIRIRIILVTWIRIRIASASNKIRIGIKVMSWIWNRNRILIRINLQITSQTVWNMSLFSTFSRVWAFIWKLGSGSGSGFGSASGWKVGSESASGYASNKNIWIRISIRIRIRMISRIRCDADPQHWSPWIKSKEGHSPLAFVVFCSTPPIPRWRS